MPSKYDIYWQNKLLEIEQLLKDAYKNGESGEIDVSDIINYGERNSWYGVVEVLKDGIRKGEMAHARSLGKVITRNKLLDVYEESGFRIVISTNLKLRMERLNVREASSVRKQPTAKGPVIASERWDEISLRIHEIVESLPSYRYPVNRKDLPDNGIYLFYEEGEKIQLGSIVKDRIVRVGTHKKQGRFPDRILNHFNGNKNSSVFRKHLGGAFIRKKNPGDPRLMQWLKQDTPTFNDIEALVSAYLRKRCSFRFLKVDKKEERLDLEERLIATLARCSYNPSEKWLGRFAASEKIRMSGLWNDQHVSSDNTMTPQHLFRLKEIVGQTGDSATKENDFSVIGKLASERQIVCFLPCCAKKFASGRIVGQQSSITRQDLPNTWNLLIEGRNGMRQCFNFSSPQTSAIYLYIGAPYSSFQPYIPNIIHKISQGQLRVIIISAGYGIVDAFEPLHSYDAAMKGAIASYWKNSGLINIISDLLLTIRPSKVFGFFAGESHWLTPGSKYRYFFTEGLKMALNQGLDIELGGCFYRVSGKGVKAILGALGQTFVNLVNSGFSSQFAIKIQNNPQIYGNVSISFDRII